jgi:hypothetical protein
VVVETKELSDEGAAWLANRPGSAQGLQEAGTIGPYNFLSKFTKGWRGVFETHHIAEKQWFKYGPLKGDPDLVPSVILTKAEHERITKELGDWVKKNNPKTPKDLWKMYEKIYKKYPHWLEAIKPYFGK